MTEEEPEHQRHSIRLKGTNYSAAGGYYVTSSPLQWDDDKENPLQPRILV